MEVLWRPSESGGELYKEKQWFSDPERSVCRRGSCLVSKNHHYLRVHTEEASCPEREENIREEIEPGREGCTDRVEPGIKTHSN